MNSEPLRGYIAPTILISIVRFGNVGCLVMVLTTTSLYVVVGIPEKRDERFSAHVTLAVGIECESLRA